MTQARNNRPVPCALWIVPVADLGGVARHVLDVSEVGIPGWELIVLCPEGPLAARIRAQGRRVIVAPFGAAEGVSTSIRTLRRVVNQLRPQIVHSHLAYADIINALVRGPAGVRRFTTEHGIAGEDDVYHRSSLQARFMALVHRWRFRRFDGVIAVSRATRGAMITKWRVKQPITVIANGVDLPAGVERRDPSSLTGMRILSLSRLAAEKRINELIEAFTIVHAERPDATLTIAGDGPLRGELEAQAKELDVADNVRFPGFMDPETAMADADVVVQLSVWENCSYTLLDAAARGLRVVATDVGGNAEFLPAECLVRGGSAAVARALLSQDPPGDGPILATRSQLVGAIGHAYRSDDHASSD